MQLVRIRDALGGAGAGVLPETRCADPRGGVVVALWGVGVAGAINDTLATVGRLVWLL